MDNLFTTIQNLSNIGVVNKDDVSINAGLSANDLKALEILNNLNPNDTLTGIVSELKGDTATILLSGNVTVTANLDSSISLTEGSPVVFEVGKDRTNAVSLRPLFTNVSNQNLAESALKAAEVPMNERSFSMLSSMIDKGMPIDKESVSALYRSVSNNPEIPVNEIVTMKSIGLPITSDNIAKFDAVVNFQAKITDSVSAVIDEVPKEIERLFDKDYEAFSKLADSVLPKEIDYSDSDNVAVKSNGQQVVNENADILSKEVLNTDSKLINGEAVSDDKITSLPTDNNSGILDDIKRENAISLSERVFDNKTGELKDNEDVLKLARQILDDKEIPKEIKESVIKSDVFKNALKDSLSKEWLINPEDFKDSKSINEHFEKIVNACNLLTENMGNELKNSETLMNAVDNFRENLSFLDNLNNLAPYVQIPMRMGDDANTGDLYVYAKKKNLLENSDNLSALLRLDMKNLGFMEVYVKLTGGKNISTDFTFEREDSLLFVEKNINILNERLEKTGYKITNSFNTKKTAPPVFENEKADKDGETINLYKFDVRA